MTQIDFTPYRERLLALRARLQGDMTQMEEARAMRVERELRLDFDDMLIRPKRSVAPGRTSIDLPQSCRFRVPLPRAGGILFVHPVRLPGRTQ